MSLHTLDAIDARRGRSARRCSRPWTWSRPCSSASSGSTIDCRRGCSSTTTAPGVRHGRPPTRPRAARSAVRCTAYPSAPRTSSTARGFAPRPARRRWSASSPTTTRPRWRDSRRPARSCSASSTPRSSRPPIRRPRAIRGTSPARRAARRAARPPPSPRGWCRWRSAPRRSARMCAPRPIAGCVGLKPTFGRISTRGVMPLSYSQDHVGLMARSVEDIALGLSITAGHDPEDAELVARAGARLSGGADARGARRASASCANSSSARRRRSPTPPRRWSTGSRRAGAGHRRGQAAADVSRRGRRRAT